MEVHLYITIRMSVTRSLELLVILLIVTSINKVTSGDISRSSHHRQTRHLVYMPRGAFKLVLGLRIPMQPTPKFVNIGWTINFQFQYQLPTNYTQLKLPVGRSLRAIDRKSTYTTLEDYMQGRGLAGRECLLLSVCEAATAPLQYDGLIGEIIQILLSPRWKPSCEYWEARLLGERGVDCRAVYPSCSTSILGLVSRLH